MAEVRLALEGMTCASCAARIERKLNKLDGVDATVNFATEQATVQFEPGVSVDVLVHAVYSAGYEARETPPAHVHHYDEPGRAMWRRFLVAAVLTLPVALLAMVTPLEFSGWEWLAFVLATPVVFWSGIGFHRAALKAARHLSASMDTLISMGTLAAWSWSAVVVMAGLDADTYFELATAFTTPRASSNRCTTST